jgi:type I restriction enzyme S subunit
MTDKVTSDQSEWRSVPFLNCIDELPFSKPRKTLARDYAVRGVVPVVDQGQALIAGWIDDESAAIHEGLPLIVFGDHTRVFKFVDFPFAPGADGTQLLKPNADFNARFFYYACLGLPLPNRGYNRHFTVLKEQVLPQPPKPEQEKIAAVLWRVQRAIEIEKKLIATARELKQSAMHQLFTQGLRGELQTETELGPLPMSWEVVPLGRHAMAAQYGLSIRGNESGRLPILRMNCQVDGRVEFRDLQFVDVDDDTLSAFRLNDGDLLFNRTNSHELVGRMAIFRSQREVVFASYLIRLSLDQNELVPEFVNYYFNQSTVQADLKRLASRGVSQSNINASKLREYPIPKAPPEEQREISHVLQAIDGKIDVHERKRATLEDLFKTLLHQLMTGEIRVAGLDIDVSEVVRH